VVAERADDVLLAHAADVAEPPVVAQRELRELAFCGVLEEFAQRTRDDAAVEVRAAGADDAVPRREVVVLERERDLRLRPLVAPLVELVRRGARELRRAEGGERGRAGRRLRVGDERARHDAGVSTRVERDEEVVAERADDVLLAHAADVAEPPVVAQRELRELAFCGVLEEFAQRTRDDAAVEVRAAGADDAVPRREASVREREHDRVRALDRQRRGVPAEGAEVRRGLRGEAGGRGAELSAVARRHRAERVVVREEREERPAFVLGGSEQEPVGAQDEVEPRARPELGRRFEERRRELGVDAAALRDERDR